MSPGLLGDGSRVWVRQRWRSVDRGVSQLRENTTRKGNQLTNSRTPPSGRMAWMGMWRVPKGSASARWYCAGSRERQDRKVKESVGDFDLW